MTDLPQVPPPRCIHLQGKAMAVHGESFEDDPDFQAGMGDCWCNQTGRPLGPDNGPVALAACRNPERDCYEEY
jgi:hypothetical protein